MVQISFIYKLDVFKNVMSLNDLPSIKKLQSYFRLIKVYTLFRWCVIKYVLFIYANIVCNVITENFDEYIFLSQMLYRPIKLQHIRSFILTLISKIENVCIWSPGNLSCEQIVLQFPLLKSCNVSYLHVLVKFS